MGVSLTHVSIWRKNNWERVSAEQAAALYPNGRSAANKTFVCDLCGQYVTFVRGSIMIPHFRHNSKDEIKMCEDRRLIYSRISNDSNSAKGLPLKLCFNNNGFKLQIGFTPLPKVFITDKNDYEIRIVGNNTLNYNYSRINDSITYLDVGVYPSKDYKIIVNPNISFLNKYWPQTVDGIAYEGTMFDKRSGKKLPYDADVQVDREYYILSTLSVIKDSDELIVKEIYNDRKSRWRITLVKATGYTEKAAKFFLKYHCRLTVNPVKLFPLWPEYIESPYLVTSNKSYMFFAIDGHLDRFEPLDKLRLFPYSEPYKLFYIKTDEEQINISVGRLGVLRYLGVIKSDINGVSSLPEINVVDLNGNTIPQGESTKLPIKHTICISSQYDGFIEISDDNYSTRRYFKANELIEVDKISFGKEVRIYVGLDKVWNVKYISSSTYDVSINELIKSLDKYGGRKVPIDHSLGGIIYKCDEKKLKEWIYKKIKEGYIEERALKLLKKFFEG